MKRQLGAFVDFEFPASTPRLGGGKHSGPFKRRNTRASWHSVDFCNRFSRQAFFCEIRPVYRTPALFLSLLADAGEKIRDYCNLRRSLCTRPLSTASFEERRRYLTERESVREETPGLDPFLNGVLHRKAPSHPTCSESLLRSHSFPTLSSDCRRRLTLRRGPGRCEDHSGIVRCSSMNSVADKRPQSQNNQLIFCTNRMSARALPAATSSNRPGEPSDRPPDHCIDPGRNQRTEPIFSWTSAFSVSTPAAPSHENTQSVPQLAFIRPYSFLPLDYVPP